ncbi:hypothetical protein ACERZ8_03490 [Tateyamaria armeniaca]|uniref:PIN domain-containing protein n=1 Tax=Tateyamaria armeniaca TaxID=2518930 RepID=A0ABW8UPF4_9RHOB
MSTQQHLKRFTAQLGQLIDLCCTIDRNEDDDRYSAQGHEVIYVFDTNIVQMFLEPYKNPHFCEVLHTPLWRTNREFDLDINSQACLISAEYLFSGELPGQKNCIWHMTVGHKKELDGQEYHLRSYIKDNVERMRGDEDFKNSVLQNMSNLSDAIEADPKGDRRTFEAWANQLPYSSPWLSELAGLSGKEFSERAAGLRSREVCRLLASDDVAEPANQLFRYRSREIAGRFRTLESRLAPDANERNEINEEVESWRAQLADVMSRHPSNIKTREGFKADCQALGLISWAARQRKFKDVRILLVTGDTVLLEAYRSRHVKNPRQEQYLVRPISHYAPIFNAVSAKATLSTQKYAFRKLQQVLEFLLVSINLHLLVEAEDEERLRARDAFVLDVQAQIDEAIAQVVEAFPQSQEIVWLREKVFELERLVNELRPIEQLMLEAFPKLVAARLKQERVSFEQASENGGERLFIEIEKKLASAGEIGAHFSLQTTPDSVTRLFDEYRDRLYQRTRRATVHVQLKFVTSISGDAEEADLAINRFAELGLDVVHKELQFLTEAPAKLFALAALIAFRLEIWIEAARYSNLAAIASLENTKYLDDSGATPDEHYEYEYLVAVAQRFRISSFEPSVDVGFSNAWEDWLSSADAILVEAINVHTESGQLSRVMRARSERAAIHVSFCEWFAFGALAEPMFFSEPAKHCLKSFSIVVSELRACEDSLAEAEVRAASSVVKTGKKGYEDF